MNYKKKKIIVINIVQYVSNQVTKVPYHRYASIILMNQMCIFMKCSPWGFRIERNRVNSSMQLVEVQRNGFLMPKRGRFLALGIFLE